MPVVELKESRRNQRRTLYRAELEDMKKLKDAPKESRGRSGVAMVEDPPLRESRRQSKTGDEPEMEREPRESRMQNRQNYDEMEEVSSGTRNPPHTLVDALPHSPVMTEEAPVSSQPDKIPVEIEEDPESGTDMTGESEEEFDVSHKAMQERIALHRMRRQQRERGELDPKDHSMVQLVAESSGVHFTTKQQ